jgi:DNA-binding LacI/PurR family transcriptional regulator
VAFVGRPRSAPTVDARISGYKEAMSDAGLPASIHRVDPEDCAELRRVMAKVRPDGFVCANDFTAAQLLKTLNTLGVAVPDQVRMVGIDDGKRAALGSPDDNSPTLRRHRGGVARPLQRLSN